MAECPFVCIDGAWLYPLPDVLQCHYAATFAAHLAAIYFFYYVVITIAHDNAR